MHYCISGTVHSNTFAICLVMSQPYARPSFKCNHHFDYSAKVISACLHITSHSLIKSWTWYFNMHKNLCMIHSSIDHNSNFHEWVILLLSGVVIGQTVSWLNECEKWRIAVKYTSPRQECILQLSFISHMARYEYVDYWILAFSFVWNEIVLCPPHSHLLMTVVFSASCDTYWSYVLCCMTPTMHILSK